MSTVDNPRMSGDELAVGRTVMAAERTLMAWMRTSFSMIGFGFTIYNFLKSFVGQPGVRLARYGPRNLAIALIGLGTLSLAIAIVQHVSLMRQLNQPPKAVWSLATMVATLIALIGVLALISVVFRAGPF